MSLLDKANAILTASGQEKLLKKHSNETLTDNYNFCLYRFLDKNRKVLYIGKCARSNHSNGHGGTKEYFIKDRIQQHYSPSSKQMPKSLYLNTTYIEVCFPDVSNNADLEYVESQLISYYERNKLECQYNLDLQYSETIYSDDMNWIEYDVKTESQREELLCKYGFTSMPELEIINERLKAMLWIIEELNTNKLKGVI